MAKKRLKSNRHKKLKAVDPFYSGERKILLDKALIRANEAPKDDDENFIPSKLREYMELNEKLKHKKKELKTKNNLIDDKKKKIKGRKNLEKKALEDLVKNIPDDKGADIPLRKLDKLNRLENESDVAYLDRIEQKVQSVIQRSQYETQFDVKLETKGDKIEIKKEKKMSEKKRKRLQKLREKLKNIKLSKKMEKENKDGFKKNVVKFGDVVDHPPELTAFPKLKKRQISSKQLTIPENVKTKSGVTEKDRNE
ncbi:coiled-coil domain-containing protein, partial [Brachionus plicatilis]